MSPSPTQPSLPFRTASYSTENALASIPSSSRAVSGGNQVQAVSTDQAGKDSDSDECTSAFDLTLAGNQSAALPREVYTCPECGMRFEKMIALTEHTVSRDCSIFDIHDPVLILSIRSDLILLHVPYSYHYMVQ